MLAFDTLYNYVRITLGWPDHAEFGNRFANASRYFDVFSNQQLARLCDVSVRQVCRWAAAGGLSPIQADRAAGALGLHPFDIWPDWYEATADGLAPARQETAA